MPRFDALLEKSKSRSKKTILIAPTWREHLLTPKAAFTGARVLIDNFQETPYFKSWKEFLSDSRLIELAKRTGLQIVFLPHPGLSEMVDFFELPEEFRLAKYSDGDIQTLFAEAQIVVTDYSSIAFDVVYAGARLVYFQFDRDSVHGSGHIMRAGYFSYDDDGLGPVAVDVDGLFESLDQVSESLPDEYQKRVDTLGWDRDGLVCERVYKEIMGLAMSAVDDEQAQ